MLFPHFAPLAGFKYENNTEISMLCVSRCILNDDFVGSARQLGHVRQNKRILYGSGKIKHHQYTG